MRAVVFCGIQASGKSTYFRDRFAATHVRLSLDLLRTRHREDVLLHACLAVGQPFVVDNTNPTVAGRARYLALAQAAGFSVDLFFFDATVDAALRRNVGRPGEVPELGVRGTFAKLQVPTVSEAFDRITRVTIGDDGAFHETEVAA
jgi:predicted kinase